MTGSEAGVASDDLDVVGLVVSAAAVVVRVSAVARPRQVAMALAKELTQLSLPEIGSNFGGRDHTTVLHAVRKIAAERQKNTDLNHQLHVLEQTLKG